MDKTIVIGLSGHTEQFRLDQDAYDRLSRYLDRAATRLQDDPDRTDVIGDLERSVGDKLSVLLGSDDRIVTAADIDGVLDEIGAVDTGKEPAPDDSAGVRPRPRRLYRIREGEWVFGVCNGLAEYSDMSVDWVRTIFFFATLFTAGLFAIVYIAMAFILPVKATRQA